MGSAEKNNPTTKPTSKTEKLDNLHHVAVPVPNVAEAVEWYTSRFDCRVEYIDDTWALLAFDNTKLALVIPRQHPSHFAIARSDANKFGELVGHRDGSKSVYIKDPFGNSVEILEKPKSGK